MSLSNKKNKVDDNEILETFFRGFFTDTKVLEEIGNAENKIVFTYSDLFFFFKCTCSDLEHTFSEHTQHNLIHRTEIFKQLILNMKFLDV